MWVVFVFVFVLCNAVGPAADRRAELVLGDSASPARLCKHRLGLLYSTVLVLHIVPIVSQYIFVNTVSLYPTVLHNVHILTSSQSPRCTSWEDNKMATWQDDKMTRWQDDKMTEWQDDRMIRCHDCWQNLSNCFQWVSSKSQPDPWFQYLIPILDVLDALLR